MQAFSISLIVNIILGISIVSLVFGPKVISLYKKKKKVRETRFKTYIKQIVIEYLNELKND